MWAKCALILLAKPRFLFTSHSHPQLMWLDTHFIRWFTEVEIMKNHWNSFLSDVWNLIEHAKFNHICFQQELDFDLAGVYDQDLIETGYRTDKYFTQTWLSIYRAAYTVKENTTLNSKANKDMYKYKYYLVNILSQWYLQQKLAAYSDTHVFYLHGEITQVATIAALLSHDTTRMIRYLCIAITTSIKFWNTVQHEKADGSLLRYS